MSPSGCPLPGLATHGSGSTPNATSVAARANSRWLFILELPVAAAAVDRLVTGTFRVRDRSSAVRRARELRLLAASRTR